ncbi:hypothetical protein F443_01601 [Phytophthora nicotianae P1569]|uniref:Uncharacterized protein n=2 Tax=Phytophthora nicotianae TaxID=4792 RepID=V9FW84_PHYNI|nr:hypothetical protein F443_01601 [Phytophthora nicotianae P1569]
MKGEGTQCWTTSPAPGPVPLVPYNEAVSEFQDRNSTPEAQLVAASSFGVIVPPDTARRIADLESQQARSQSDLQVARDRQSALASELSESATSHNAAQAKVARLDAAIKRKNGRLRTLNDNYERPLRVADTTIATHTAELFRLQDWVSTLDRDLQKASQPVQTVTSQRDQARQHISPPRIVSQRRDTIARLEKRINQVERSTLAKQCVVAIRDLMARELDATHYTSKSTSISGVTNTTTSTITSNPSPIKIRRLFPLKCYRFTG